MDLSEEKLDLNLNKIKQLEIDITILNDNVNVLHDQMKEMQRFIIKLTHNQSEITKRLSAWPYIAVSEK